MKVTTISHSRPPAGTALISAHTVTELSFSCTLYWPWLKATSAAIVEEIPKIPIIQRSLRQYIILDNVGSLHALRDHFWCTVKPRFLGEGGEGKPSFPPPPPPPPPSEISGGGGGGGEGTLPLPQYYRKGRCGHKLYSEYELVHSSSFFDHFVPELQSYHNGVRT